MKQILFINKLETLNIKKDSSLLMALTFQSLGMETFLLFEEDLFVYSFDGLQTFPLYRFEGDIGGDFYIKKFELKESEELELKSGDLFHFRLDPPVDEHYLKSLWMVQYLSEKMGFKVSNSPLGILKHNEKILAYQDPESLESCISSTLNPFLKFREKFKSDFYIFKPLNSFSGYGIERIENNDAFNDRAAKILEKNKGAMIMQPYVKSITEKGELRTVFWKEKEIGTILKMPAKGSFLSNIAQGASFQAEKLSLKLKKRCEEICHKLSADGVDLVAFDILDGKISEVNITCPGLLVEVSHAFQKNLVLELS